MSVTMMKVAPQARDTTAPVSGPWQMSAANRLTIARILLVPAIVAALLYYAPERDWLRLLALGLFALGIATDALDGWIARQFNQRTELGVVLDPVADKALILSTLISCSVITGLPAWMRVPAWFNLVVISRDVVLVGGAIVSFTARGRWTVRPSLIGKCTTVAQMAVIMAVLLHWPVREPLLAVAALLTVASGIDYLRSGSRLLQ